MTKRWAKGGVFAVWCWNARTESWYAINEGALVDMRAAAERLYAAALRHGLDDVAYYVATASRVPSSAPAQLGVELTAAALS